MIHKGFFKLALIAIAASFSLSAQSAMTIRSDNQIAMAKCSRSDKSAGADCVKCNKGCEPCDKPCQACPDKQKCESCPCPESCDEPCPSCPSDCGGCPSNGKPARKGAAKANVQGN